MILTEKQQKYQHYHLEKLINTNLTYSRLGKAFEKQTKMIEEQERKQTDAITNQNKRLSALTNKEIKTNIKMIIKTFIKKYLKN